MTTYWKAEVFRNGEPYDCDFQARETAAEAVEDAQNRMSDFTDRERERMSAWASEWQTDDGGETSTNTGNVVELDD